MSITAKVIADSISTGPFAQRITTFELEYPRFIHAEFMTHRLFSRNAASSRAIPVKKAIELIKADTAKPIHWGKNQPGMSAKEECNEPVGGAAHVFGATREGAWDFARDKAIFMAEAFDKAGYHKQIVNRLLEPFSHIKVVCTATEYDNFFYLRCHPDAQPEIQELAEQMWKAREQNVPVKLNPGDWHMPYFQQGFWLEASAFGSLDDALAISSSCCAQVSYRVLNDSLEKAKDIFARLVESKPVHASPFEHQATPMLDPYYCDDEQVLLACHPDNETLDADGITHFDRNGYAWSGNLKGWIQHRQLIKDNVCNSYSR
jgi:hypothetical protein